MPVQINSEVIVKPVRAIVSASYLYPLKGIYYFLAHPAFYPLFGRRLFPLVVTSIIVLGLLFTFTYLPQVAFLAIFNGHLAWFNAAFLVLGEGQVAISLLFEAFLVDETLVDVFDAVLVNEGRSDFIAHARVLFPDAENCVKMLGKPTETAIYSPFSFRQIIEFILFLPLNFIPIIGTPLFLIITGARAGPLHHYRFYKLRGCSAKTKKTEVKRMRWRYTWFGTVALMLQLVPILSMFFLLTTAAGSALWVVALEKEQKVLRSGPAVYSSTPAVYSDRRGRPVNNVPDEEAPPPPYTDTDAPL